MTKARGRIVSRVGALLVPLALLVAPTAHAQEAPPPRAQTAPPTAQAPNGEYTAPLSQTTQPTYVPQSVALSGPRVLSDWEEGDPIPPGYHVVSRARRGLIIGGAIPAGVFYLFSVLAASIMADTGSHGGALYIPGVGPFIQMASTTSATGNTVLAIDGIVQTGGILMVAVGIAGKNVLVRNDLGLTITPTPLVLGRGGGGVGLAGSF